MNSTIKTLYGLMAGAILIAGCASGEDGLSGLSGTSSTNIISTKHFTLTFSDLNPQVYDTVGGTIDNGVTVTVTATAGDRADAFVTSGTINFKTEVGLLSTESCALDSTGSCSATWTSSMDGGDLPADFINTITAWTNGEESFLDMNGNGFFDDGDVFTHDTGDPFLDLTHDGVNPVYDPGVDPLIISPDYVAPDGLYTGSNCQHSSLCATTASKVLFDTNEMLLSY
jgi:hypothetical protein